MERLYGGIEAGGTKFNCMVGAGPDTILAEKHIPTLTPQETIRQVLAFFEPFVRRKQLVAVGIGSFGPLDLHPESPAFGSITNTPKAGWQYVNLRTQVLDALELPVSFDTDVNTAAFGEQYWNPENHGLESFIYVTVGTGIGVGTLVNGRPFHGLVHSEAGHLPLPHDWERDPFPGICPYHGDCLEGLASGPALAKRWGRPAENLPAGHPAWRLEAEYLAFGLASLIYTCSPERIVLGGGVSQHPGLHALVRRKVQALLNGYIHSPLLLEQIDRYITAPALGNRSAMLGAVAMAMEAAGQGDVLKP
ncbi:MAG: ROK family protein [Anaerolineaceae bacterium]|nr:ROK family protein [Anaerolineaceae bacterium]